MTLQKSRAEFWGVEGAESRESETGQGFSVSWGKTKWSTIDANGNETASDTYRYTYDAANRLVQVNSLNPTPPTVADTIQMTYDGLGRRVGITESHGSTVLTSKTFVWCHGELCQERDSTGHTVTKQFFFNGEQINGTNYYYTRDHLGSVREMVDSSGTVQARYDYDAWGRQTALSQAVTADFGYTGFYVNKTTGLDLTWFRAYDPEKGRWLSRDPLADMNSNPLSQILFQEMYPSTVGSGAHPQSRIRGMDTNLYDYVKNNPFDLTDPFGLDPYKPPPDWHPPMTWPPAPYYSPFGYWCGQCLYVVSTGGYFLVYDFCHTWPGGQPQSYTYCDNEKNNPGGPKPGGPHTCP
jgi:RHS repeat-associated protein